MGQAPHFFIASVLCLEGIVLKSVEHGGEIAFACIWQQGDNLLALVLWTLGYLDGCKECSTGRDTYEQTFRLGYLTACADGIVVLYVKDLVDNV